MPNLKFVGDEQIPLETPKVGIIQNLDLVPIKRQPEASTEAGNTTFLFKKKDISLDLLTDSGVNAISDRQTSPTPDADDDTHPGTRPPAAPGGVICTETNARRLPAVSLPTRWIWVAMACHPLLLSSARSCVIVAMHAP